MMRLRFLVETSIFRTLLGISRVVPRKVLLGLGSAIGSLGYVIDSRHRRIALDNLRLAYGDDYEPGWGQRVVRNCWRHFGRITADSMALSRMSVERMQSLVDYEGLEHIRAAYAQGKGVLVFSGHFGNWELTAMTQGYLGLPLCLVARPLDNPDLERLLARLRERSGNRIIHKRNAVREMLRAVREKKGVAIVIDQDARSDGVFVPFFGRLASTTPTLALLALRTGAVVIPSFSVPLDKGRYRVVYEPPVEVPSSGDRDRDVLELTATCTAIIEKWVRRYPEQWLWMHRRWKTTPEGE
jgi:KDO2-lipid IV(A) lauroyltransferase